MIAAVARWLPVSLALHGAVLAATLLVPGEVTLAPLLVDLTLQAPVAEPPSRGGGATAARPRSAIPRAMARRAEPAALAGASAAAPAPPAAPSTAEPTSAAASSVAPPALAPRVPASAPPPTASPAPEPSAVSPPAPVGPPDSPPAAMPQASAPIASSAPSPTAGIHGDAAGEPAPATSRASGDAGVGMGGGVGESGGRGVVGSSGAAGGAAAAGAGALALAVPGDGAGMYASYLALLRRRVQEAVTYPQSARRRGLSGTVHLEITLEASGRVGDVTLVRSSSHAVLDEAAMDGVRALRRVPFPSDVRPRPLRVRLPVVFELR
jgi:protein TonB